MKRISRLGIAAVAASVAATGVGAVPHATSASSTSCPEAFPVAELEDDIDKGRTVDVTGLTVDEGTKPEDFKGEVLGVLKDGIAPGLDMIMVRLESREIDRVGGIWAGMSGSPVYADDDRLIGAVAYGLSFGPSPVAGVTPAEDMLELLKLAPGSNAAQRTLRQAAAKERVAIPPALARQVAASGAERPSEVREGMTRLPIPLGISGMANQKRLRKLSKALDLDGVRVYASSAATTARSSSDPIEAGGNLAASLSFGDITAVGVGTATAVCGDEVVGFGHPMIFTGPSTLTMHNADAIYIQEDKVSFPFKVANAGGPIGGVTQDRLAGILGIDGAAPDTTGVRSTVRLPSETRMRKGETQISVPDAVPDLAAFHLLANQDRVFDAFNEGSSTVTFTVTGTRKNGSTFTYKRKDRFASEFDISFESVFDMFDQLARIHFNDLEDVTIDEITQTSVMSRVFKSFKIAAVDVRSRGRWAPVRTDRPLVVRAGSTQRFRVRLTSQQLPNRRVFVDLVIPRRAAGKFGFLEIFGGNSFFPGDNGVSVAPTTFPGLLRQLAREPRNDQVVANLLFFRNDGTAFGRSKRKQLTTVVNDGLTVEVVAVR